MGLSLAVPNARTICYVEIEIPAIKILVSRIKDQTLDWAPIWTDLKTFNCRPFRGKVDCVIGGYPCQPFSVAGKRLGDKDTRHLWPHISKIVSELKPKWCFFENVCGHLRLGFDSVYKDLRGLGYDVEPGLFSAQEVGAPHERCRLFILAHTKDERGKEESSRQDKEWQIKNERRRCFDGSDFELAHFKARTSERLGFASCEPIEKLENSNGIRYGGGSKNRGEILDGEKSEVQIKGSDRELGIPESKGLQRCSIAESPKPEVLTKGCFPPGPSHLEEWAEVLREHPALEPAICRVADGTPARVDRIRALGNGVVPVVAVLAFRTLGERLSERIYK